MSAMRALLAAKDATFWLPPQNAAGAAEIDWMFYFILYTSAVFFILIVGVQVYFMIRYRRSAGVKSEPSTHHSTSLEVLWSVLPCFLLAVMFYYGWIEFAGNRRPPKDAYPIEVRAMQWQWGFRYAQPRLAFETTHELHVPVDTSIVLEMRSSDVIHSVFVPAFRVKFDVVPGRITKLWFKPTTTGEFRLICAEFCGKSHSDMVARVVVHTKPEFASWVKQKVLEEELKSTAPAWVRGKDTYLKRGCIGCHVTAGTPTVGPSFKNLWGTEEEMEDGTKVEVDRAYVYESIRQPGKKIVKGFGPPKPPMQVLPVSDREIDWMIAYLKHLAGEKDE